MNINKLIRRIKEIPKETKILIAIILLVIIIATPIIVTNLNKQKLIVFNGSNLDENRYPKYKELIDNLASEHPNWTFTLLYTKLNWNSVIRHEGHSDTRTSPLNLVPYSSNYSGEWQCEKDKDKTYDTGDWVCASTKAIEYRMDPRNILNEERIFQFKELNYNEEAQTIEGIMSRTAGSFLEGESVAKALLEAAKNSNIDAYFIVSRLIQEQGKDGTRLSRGYEYNGTVVYNPFNIAASGNSTSTILENAAEYAYSQGWDTLEKAILGGIDFLNTKYINKGQNTLYLQKFDIIKKDKLYTNQYMQNLIAPGSEAVMLQNQYEKSDTLDSEFNFIIPLYENMPEEICEEPKNE